VNQFGTTRQDVGGSDKDLPRRRKWYDTVPFRPCRPPVPPWLLDWPLEVRDRESLQFLSPGTNCVSPGQVLGDPSSPAPVPVGPLAVPGDTLPTVNSAQRSWGGRVRQAGDLRTILYSPVYVGPARVTHLTFAASYVNPGLFTTGFMWGAVPGAGASQFKQLRSSVPVPQGTSFIDIGNFSDNENPHDDMIGFIDVGGQSMTQVPLNVDLPYNSFSLYCIFDTTNPNAGAVDFVLTFEPRVVTVGGNASSRGPNQFNAQTYLGGFGG